MKHGLLSVLCLASLFLLACESRSALQERLFTSCMQQDGGAKPVAPKEAPKEDTEAATLQKKLTALCTCMAKEAMINEMITPEFRESLALNWSGGGEARRVLKKHGMVDGKLADEMAMSFMLWGKCSGLGAG